MNFKTLIFIQLAVTMAWCQPAESKTLERVDVALQRLFPKAAIARKSTVLTEPESTRLAELLGEKVTKSLVSYYQITLPDGEQCYAYLDAHRVRTLPQTLLISLSREGVVYSVDVLLFREPEEYLPKRAWYDQFKDKQLTKNLRLNRGIQGVSGATLTGQATVSSTRKVLAIHRILMDRTHDDQD
jgi:hypothetical protein